MYKCSDPNFEGARYLNLNNTEGARALFMKWWQELSNLYGTSVRYYVNNYSLTGHDFIYGEHPTAPYTGPYTMIVLAEMNNDTLLLSKFGIQTNADLTIVIPRQTFATSLSSVTLDPKSGDVIQLTELGWTRPGGPGDPYTTTTDSFPTTRAEVCSAASNALSAGAPNTFNQINYDQLRRCPNLYEITERRDENLTMGFNPLLGHYVWLLWLKRFDYSYEPGITPECNGGNQVSDETFYGRLSGGTNPKSPDKKYSDNIPEEADKNWKYPDNEDSIYGDYGH